MSGAESNPRSRLRDRALEAGLIALILLSPLPFGSVEPWAVLVIEGLAACVGMLALLILVQEPKALSRRACAALVPTGLLVLIGLLQLLPPGRFGAVPAPSHTARTRAAIARVLPEAVSPEAPESLAAPDTVDALLRILACAAIAVATAIAARDTSVFTRIGLAIALSGAFQAFYGLAEYLSGHQHIFAYAKRYYVEEATGTFINRNHFAGYLAMTLPFSLVYLLSIPRDRLAGPRWRDGILRAARPRSVKRLLAGCCVALVWSAILLSYSRGGLATAIVASAIVVASTRKGRKTAWLAAAVLLGPILLLLWMDVQAPGERLLLLGEEAKASSGRLVVWRETLEIVPSYLLLGSGFGTFEETFASHQPPAITKRYDHAHNDWLQCLLEGGIGALAACIALLAIVIYPVREGAGPPGKPRVSRIAPAAGVIAIALHSLVDFGLRIPAVAVLLAVVVGLALSWDAARTTESVARPLAAVRSARV